MAIGLLPRLFSLSRSRCSKGGFGLWLGDKGIVNSKMSTSTYILIGYGPTPPSFSLNSGRKHSREDIKLVEELLLGFLAGAASKTLQLGLLAGVVAETLILSLRHLE